MKKLIVIFFLFILCSQVVIAEDDPFWSGENDPVYNDYGIVKCWYSKDNSTWQEATVNNAEVKLGEPFYIKIFIKSTKELNGMTFHMSGIDEDMSDFEVISGPSNISKTYVIYQPELEKIYTFFWKIRVNPNSNWGGGNSPLNIDVGFTKDGNHNLPPFTIVNINILNEVWGGSSTDPINNSQTDGGTNSDKNGTPGFEFMLIFAAFLIVSLMYHFNIRKKQR